MEKKLSYLKIYSDIALEWLEEDPNSNGEWAEREIKIYDFISDCTMTDLFALFDSGMFNWVVLGYCKKAMDDLVVSDDIRDSVIREIKNLFDFMTAAEAEAYHTTH